MATCRGCGADIIFARTAQGALMPLNAATTKIATVARVPNEVITPRVIELVVGHVPHHITCPKADEYRGKGPHGQPATPGR